jgi:hydroxymethylpyrimidine/phosphomethylpyrimidine kinase
MQNERNFVKYEVKKTLEKIEKSDFAKLIPEVGSNIVYAVKGAKNISDVAAVPGRIRNAMGRPVFLQPEFGTSTHIGSLVLRAMKYDKEKRSAINIKYSEDIVKICKDLGLAVFFSDRSREPAEVKEKEGESVPWSVDHAFEKLHKMPDVIYHTGSVGKEPIITIIGKNPEQNLKIIFQILQRIK